jgi:hypothetical protein
MSSYRIIPIDSVNSARDRRSKYRFPMQCDLRYRLLKDGAPLETGLGHTIDIGSGGVSFAVDHDLPSGHFIELAIRWPVLLDDSCPMQLVVFGRVLRCQDGKCACTVGKYEFRTQARSAGLALTRTDSVLRRWAETVRREAPITVRQMRAHA